MCIYIYLYEYIYIQLPELHNVLQQGVSCEFMAYELAMEVVKDKYFKPYILAEGDFPGCLFMTLPRLPSLPD